MYKPANLRAHLTSANPDLNQNPDKLLVFVDQGHAIGSGTSSLSFEYQYRLNIIITDYSGDPDAIMSDDLSAVVTWAEALLATLNLAQRRRLLHRLAQDLRRDQSQRIASQQAPDGASYTPRKQRKICWENMVVLNAKNPRCLTNCAPIDS